MKTVPVAAALIVNKDRFLVAQRAKGELAGNWEFESLRGHLIWGFDSRMDS